MYSLYVGISLSYYVEFFLREFDQRVKVSLKYTLMLKLGEI